MNWILFVIQPQIFDFFWSFQSLPWDDETFIGWFYGLCVSFWMSGTYFFMNCIFLSFFLATSFNFDAFQQQFEAILSAINETNSQQSHFQRNAKQVLKRAIRFHILVQE